MNRISNLSKRLKKGKSYELYIERAECYYNADMYQKSLKDYESSERLIEDENHKRKVEVLLGKGECYFAIGEYGKAIDEFSKVLYPSDIDMNQYVERKDLIFNKRGLCHQFLNSDEDAIVDFELSIGNYDSGGYSNDLATFYYNKSMSVRKILKKRDIKSREGYLLNQKYVRSMKRAIDNFTEESDLFECYEQVLEHLVDLNDEESLDLLIVALNFVSGHRAFKNKKEKVFFYERYAEYYIQKERYQEALKYIKFLIEDVYITGEENISVLRMPMIPFIEDKLLAKSQVYSYYVNRSFCNLKLNELGKSKKDFEESEQFISGGEHQINLNYSTISLLLRKSEILEMVYGRLEDSIEIIQNSVLMQNWEHPNLLMRHRVRKRLGDCYRKQMKYEEYVKQYIYEYQRISTRDKRSKMKSKITEELDQLFRDFYYSDDDDEEEEKHPGLTFEEEYKICKKILDVLILRNHVDDENDEEEEGEDDRSVDVGEWYGLRGDVNYELDLYEEAIKDIDEEVRILYKYYDEDEEEFFLHVDANSIYTRFQCHINTDNSLLKAMNDGILYLYLVSIVSDDVEKKVWKVCEFLSRFFVSHLHRKKMSFIFSHMKDLFDSDDLEVIRNSSFSFDGLDEIRQKNFEVTLSMRSQRPMKKGDRDFMAVYYLQYVLKPFIRNRKIFIFPHCELSTTNCDRYMNLILKQIVLRCSEKENINMELFLRSEFLDYTRYGDERIPVGLSGLSDDTCVVIRWIEGEEPREFGIVEDDQQHISTQHTIRIPFYFLPPSSVINKSGYTKPISMYFGKTPKTEELLVLKCLYGYVLSDSEISKLLIPLYIIFASLEMTELLRILLFTTIEKLSLKNLIREFSKCVILFEKNNTQSMMKNEPSTSTPTTSSSYFDETMGTIDSILLMDGSQGSEDDDLESDKKTINFQTSLSLALFHKLRVKIDEIENNFIYVQALEKIGFYSNLKSSFPIQRISEHSDMKRGEDSSSSSKSFKSYFEEVVLKRLYEKRMDQKNNNYENNYYLRLRTKDMGDDDYFIVQKEILILRSNFFFQMFKSTENIENNTQSLVDIEDLSKPALDVLLKNIYQQGLGRDRDNSSQRMINNCSLKDLFELLYHSEMYDDFYLKNNVFKHINRVMKTASEEDVIILKILEVGFKLSNVSSQLGYLLTKIWARLGELKFRVVQCLIETSTKTNLLANVQEENEEMKIKLMKRVRECKCGYDDEEGVNSRKKRKKSSDGEEQ